MGVIRTARAPGPLVILAMAALLTVPPPVTASFEEELALAISLANEARHREAREVLDPLLERDSSHPRARLLDGILHAHEGRAAEAIEVFVRLRRDHPHMPEPWNNLAVLLATQGRLDEARETLLAALGRHPTAIGFANLGDVYTSLAERAYARSRELGGDAGSIPGTAEAGTVAFSVPGDPPVAARTEQAVAEGATAHPPAASGASPARGPACLRAGGFENRRAVDAARSWLESRGARVLQVHREEVRRIDRHQVYLPPLEDRSTAEESVREIRARGVRDVAVIRSGSLANGISLGVFGIRENMRRRVATLERLGYPALSRDDASTVHRHFVESRTEEDPETLRAAWTERFPGHSLERVDCD